MNLRTAMMGLGVAALQVLPASAQEMRHWSASLNYVIPTDNLKEITNAQDKYAGLNMDFGYMGHLGATNVPLRTSLGINYLPGRTHDWGGKASLTGYYLATDVYVNSGLKNLQFITGISLNKWRASVELPGVIDESQSVPGIKFGGRIGFAYQMTPALSLDGVLQVVELGHDLFMMDPMPSAGAKGLNPSWFQLGVRYSF